METLALWALWAFLGLIVFVGIGWVITFVISLIMIWKINRDFDENFRGRHQDWK
jgi:uncharacterized membrane protein (DUF485 family)